ncbi:F-box protein At5g42460 [Capsella rubella]|nr:F-box protein At5g42460 [Capsella rubella]
MTKDSLSLVVWNPYLVQTKWIKPRNNYHKSDCYAIGYDKNKNYKIFRMFYDCRNEVRHEIYDFRYNSWRAIFPSFYHPRFSTRGVSLKGNTYFLFDKAKEGIVCFDFTSESLGEPLLLPFDDNGDVILSCVGEEQLALLLCRCRVRYEMEIWITVKVEPDAMWWSKFFKVDDIQLVRGSHFQSLFKVQSFFIDKEKKIAVVSGKDYTYFSREILIVVGEDGCFQEIDTRDVFSYVPSLVKIQ